MSVPTSATDALTKCDMEVVIGYMKTDHWRGKNHLGGCSGDRFNVKMADC